MGGRGKERDQNQSDLKKKIKRGVRVEKAWTVVSARTTRERKKRKERR